MSLLSEPFHGDSPKRRMTSFCRQKVNKIQAYWRTSCEKEFVWGRLPVGQMKWVGQISATALDGQARPVGTWPEKPQILTFLSPKMLPHTTLQCVPESDLGDSPKRPLLSHMNSWESYSGSLLVFLPTCSNDFTLPTDSQIRPYFPHFRPLIKAFYLPEIPSSLSTPLRVLN